MKSSHTPGTNTENNIKSTTTFKPFNFLNLPAELRAKYYKHPVKDSFKLKVNDKGFCSSSYMRA